MQAFTVVTGLAAPLDRANVDTDQIIPAVWLKRIERTGFGEGLFSAWRQDPDFILNNPDYADGHILVARENFGCGSSREHAPWALEDYGFQAIIAPSFADIFKNNCMKLGLVPIVASEENVDKVMHAALENSTIEVTVDIVNLTWSCTTEGIDAEPFPMDSFSQYRLLNGLDDIGITLQHEADISAFEARRESFKPVVV